MYAAKIDWNDMIKDGHYETIDLISEDGTIASKLNDVQLDVVIGTDVVYWKTQIEPLIKTLQVLSDKHPGLKIYICYIERHVSTHNALKQCLAEHNFSLTEFGQDVTKGINPDSYMYCIELKSD